MYEDIHQMVNEERERAFERRAKKLLKYDLLKCKVAHNNLAKLCLMVCTIMIVSTYHLYEISTIVVSINALCLTILSLLYIKHKRYAEEIAVTLYTFNNMTIDELGEEEAKYKKTLPEWFVDEEMWGKDA